jgi:hypothetical protein
VFRRGARGLRIARHCDCFDHQRADFQTSWRRIPSFYLRHQERIMSTSPRTANRTHRSTTVREAEVRADDLSEVKPADGDKS